MAAPTIADSDRGVSITRSSPKISNRSWVTRKTPPFFPTSSPRSSTRESFSISCFKAKLIASTIVSVAMVTSLSGLPSVSFEKSFHLLSKLGGKLMKHETKHVPRVGRRHVFRFVHRFFDFVFGVRTHRVIVGFVPNARFLHVQAEALDRIFLFPLLHFFVAPVTGGVIGSGVIAETVSDALDQRRPLAYARARQCLVGGPVDCQNIIAIDLQPWKTVGNCLLRQRLGCRLSAQRN